MRVLLSSVLIAEALVIVFAALVAKDLSDVDNAVVFGVAAAGATACIALTALLRHRWAVVAGSVLQVLVVASGVVVPTMFVLGLIFAALWVLAIVLGRRVARLQEAYAARAAEDASR